MATTNVRNNTPGGGEGYVFTIRDELDLVILGGDEELVVLWGFSCGVGLGILRYGQL